jgi:hypothetical protein
MFTVLLSLVTMFYYYYDTTTNAKNIPSSSSSSSSSTSTTSTETITTTLSFEYSNNNNNKIIPNIGLTQSIPLKKEQDNNNIIDEEHFSSTTTTTTTNNNGHHNNNNSDDDLNHDRPHHHSKGDDFSTLTNTHTDKTTTSITTTDDELSESQQHLLAFAREHSFEANGKRRTVIVTVATYSYREMLLNWLNALEKLKFSTQTSVIVLCASSNSSLHDFLLKEKNLECYQTNWTVGGDYEGSRLQDPGRVWKKRIGFLALLLDAGFDVVMSDLDAIWLRDPFQPVPSIGTTTTTMSTAVVGDNKLVSSNNNKPLFSPNRADIVAGRGEFPFFISKVLGATICMGTAYFASNPRTSYLIHRAVSFTHQSEDDQYGINAALFSLMDNKYELPFKKQSKINLAGKNDAIGLFQIPLLFGNNNRISVLYVSHLQIPRFCNRLTKDEWNQYVVLAHCHLHDGAPSFVSLRGSAQAHHAVLKKYSLFQNKSGDDNQSMMMDEEEENDDDNNNE